MVTEKEHPNAARWEIYGVSHIYTNVDSVDICIRRSLCLPSEQSCVHAFIYKVRILSATPVSGNYIGCYIHRYVSANVQCAILRMRIWVKILDSMLVSIGNLNVANYAVY